MMGNLQLRLIGNCNVVYIDNLGVYENKSALAMAHLTTKIGVSNPFGDVNERNNTSKLFDMPTFGICLFARGSYGTAYDKTHQYAHQFKKYIEDHGLGTVTEIAAPNPCHGFNVGTLFAWVINREALQSWWEKNVKAAQLV